MLDNALFGGHYYLVEKYMTQQEIQDYKFEDKILDAIPFFDFCAKSALIDRKITKNDYLLLSQIVQDWKIIHENVIPGLTLGARTELKQMISGYI